jgi:hypothetical protein
MSASIRRSLRILLFLLGCLSLSVIGSRAEQHIEEVHGRMPPHPGKHLPLTTVNCTDCPSPLPQVNNNVQSACVSSYWTDGEIFQVQVVFLDNNLYKEFATQSAYFCYTPNGQSGGVIWPILPNNGKVPLSDGRTYLLVFRACDPGGQGTGTGRIIITRDRITLPYQVANPCNALQKF